MDILEQALVVIRIEAKQIFDSIDKEQLRINAPEWYDALNHQHWPITSYLDVVHEALKEKCSDYQSEFRSAFFEYHDFIKSLPLSDRRRMADHWAQTLGKEWNCKTGEEMIERMLDKYHRPLSPEAIAKKVEEAKRYYSTRSFINVDIARREMIHDHFFSDDPNELISTAL